MKTISKCIFAISAALAWSLSAFAVDSSALKPPAGAQVAIVMFEDMECPSCAFNFPVVEEAGKTHNIPVVLRDFPLGPKHPWSFEAAVFARFFDTKSEKLGRDFRAYIFRNQPQIDPTNLHQYVQKFADDNKVPLPFAVDPEGKLKAKVDADHDLGMRIGINSTPSIFVVTNNGVQQVEKFDQLNQVIEDMQRKAGPATPATPTRRAAKKKSS
ncbi:MAG TPA: thioredoxin domain-containing protein [Candidatus Angelobacter sp.]|nr:thioredoxin domain-containing protein [Candidatus Angelobacter sp.]